MKKRMIALLLAGALLFSLAACGDSDSSGAKGSEKPSESNSVQPKEPMPPDLTGEWKQTNSNADDTYQALYITENEIEVYWIMEEDDMTALYWAGTFKLPKDDKEPYSFNSENDHSRTSSALLASEDDTKTFTYENGKIKYSVSAFGETTEVEAVKQEWGYSKDSGGSGASAGRMEGSGDLGDYHVEIKGAALAEDYEGNPAIVITYAWTNNSDETTSAMVAMSEQAFQNGVELDRAIILDEKYESEASMKDIRPGTTLDVQCAFVMTSSTSTVELEITELFSFSNDMVTMNFDPAGLR